MKITAVLVVDEIEKALPFWIERMGFEKAVALPEKGMLEFVILVSGGAELMLQTHKSVAADMPQFAGSSRTSLFIEVDDFGNTQRRLQGYPIAMEERTTFYDMQEIGVFDPHGNVVVFAARV